MQPRVGLLVPSSNTVMEQDLHDELADAALVLTCRMYMVDTTAAAERRMLDDEAGPAATRVGTTNPDVVVFGCTSAASLDGLAADEVLRASLGERAGCPVIGVLDSAILALSGVGRVAVFTPYVDELTETIVASLVEAGIEVVTSRGLGIRQNVEIGMLSPHDVVAGVTSMDLRGADAVFCSCTNMRAVEARPELQRITGLPVVTSNQAVSARLARQFAQVTTGP